MSIKNKFEWVDFYRELATKLLQYKENRGELIQKVNNIYNLSKIDMPTLEKNNLLVDIDPFTVFGLFNKSSMKSDNRYKIIKAVANTFGVKAFQPTSFNSVPTMNNLNAVFYTFVDERGDKDIDDLWELFEVALLYSESPNEQNKSKLGKYFDKVIKKKFNGTAKMTMGLYWIAPNTFLNLDSRNQWYIYESGKIPVDIVQKLPKPESKIQFATYSKILEEINVYLKSNNSKIKDFKDLSFEAWRYSEEVNESRKAERDSKSSALADDGVVTRHYWLYYLSDKAISWAECQNEEIMAIGWDELGDLKFYKNKTSIREKMKELHGAGKSYKNAVNTTWEFTNEMKEGDVVFVKNAANLILGRGVVESEYEFDNSRSSYKNIRKVKWTNSGEWQHPSPGERTTKVLTDITAYTDYVNKLNDLFEGDVAYEDEQEVKYIPYAVEKFLEEVYMDKNNYNMLVELLKKKKNIIIQGAPGVGKTYVAKRLAYSMMGVKDTSRVVMVQFHQSYSYEDFIMGFRPSESGFVLEKGVFYNFCKNAESDSENDYFFIIDEINRGNLSRIFGELFMLIENDKRGLELKLLYSDEQFSVPENVYIIGMMNTADRSLAILDYALRRRFSFYEIKPGYQTTGFLKYKASLASAKLDRLIETVENLNESIIEDASLGEGFCIGHSYFCNLKDATDQQELSAIIEFELIPLLKEYWFDEPAKVKNWSSMLRSAIK